MSEEREKNRFTMLILGFFFAICVLSLGSLMLSRHWAQRSIVECARLTGKPLECRKAIDQ